MTNDHYVCPVCGYPNLFRQPWNEHLRNPSFEICPCCGIQFGDQDYPLGTTDIKERFDAVQGFHNRWRDQWISNGMLFKHIAERPEGWNPIKQLQSISY